MNEPRAPVEASKAAQVASAQVVNCQTLGFKCFASCSGTGGGFRKLLGPSRKGPSVLMAVRESCSTAAPLRGRKGLTGEGAWLSKRNVCGKNTKC